jgi:hypothetical protein
MIAFLDARHPEVATRKFRRLSETPLDAGSGVWFGPERVSNHAHHRRFREAVAGHAGEGVPAQNDRLHDGMVATLACCSIHV